MNGIRSRVMVPVAAVLAMGLAAACGGGGSSPSAGNGASSQSTAAGNSASSQSTAASSNDATGGVLGAKCDNPGATKTVNGVNLMCDKPDGRNPVWTKSKYQPTTGTDPNKTGNDPNKTGNDKKVEYPDSADAPDCPANIDTILTTPMFNPDDLLVITPLGNVSPPGHTAPIDHQYITASHAGKIPLYAPADGWIARMQTGGYSDDGGKTLKLDGFVFSLVVCHGLVLETTGNAAMEDLNPAIKALLPTNPSNAPAGSCDFGIHKAGHAHQNEWMCIFQGKLNLKVKAGDVLANLTSVTSSHGGFDFGVETWLANYNVAPPDNGVHWDWYSDNRYVHSVCLFDKFAPEVDAAYATKLGGWDPLDSNKGGIFYRSKAQAKDPICGVTVQDQPGTLLGYWFGAPDTQSKFGKSGPQYGDNAGISFIRNNANPDSAEVVDGGGLVPGSTIIGFAPAHSGTVNRDPVEVTPGSAVYCYNALGQIREALGGKSIDGDHRFVVQLVDATHAKIELQAGACTGKEALTDKAITYVR